MLRPAYMQSSEIGKQDRGGMCQQEESEETRVEDLLDWFSMPGGESKSQESLRSVDSKPNEPGENSEGEVEPVGRGQDNQDSPAPKEPRKPREPRRENKKRKNSEIEEEGRPRLRRKSEESGIETKETEGEREEKEEPKDSTKAECGDKKIKQKIEILINKTQPEQSEAKTKHENGASTSLQQQDDEWTKNIPDSNNNPSCRDPPKMTQEENDVTNGSGHHAQDGIIREGHIRRISGPKSKNVTFNKGQASAVMIDYQRPVTKVKSVSTVVPECVINPFFWTNTRLTGQAFQVATIISGTAVAMFVDCGATSCFISQRLCDKLGLKQWPIDPQEYGTAGRSGVNVKNRVLIIVNFLSFKMPVEFSVSNDCAEDNLILLGNNFINGDDYVLQVLYDREWGRHYLSFEFDLLNFPYRCPILYKDEDTQQALEHVTKTFLSECLTLSPVTVYANKQIVLKERGTMYYLWLPEQTEKWSLRGTYIVFSATILQEPDVVITDIFCSPVYDWEQGLKIFINNTTNREVIISKNQVLGTLKDFNPNSKEIPQRFYPWLDTREEWGCLEVNKEEQGKKGEGAQEEESRQLKWIREEKTETEERGSEGSRNTIREKQGKQGEQEGLKNLQQKEEKGGDKEGRERRIMMIRKVEKKEQVEPMEEDTEEGGGKEEPEGEPRVTISGRNKTDIDIISVQRDLEIELERTVAKYKEASTGLHFETKTEVVDRPQTKELHELVEECYKTREDHYDKMGTEAFFKQFTIQDDIPEDMKSKFKTLLHKFRGIFAFSLRCLAPGLRNYHVTLGRDLREAVPTVPHKSSLFQKVAMNKVIELFLKARLIIPAKGIVYSNSFILKKTDHFSSLDKLYSCHENSVNKHLRFILDLRKINRHVGPFQHPLTSIIHILAGIGRAQKVINLDLFCWFYQCEVRDDGSLAIQTFFGNNEAYCFRRLAMGLCVSPMLLSRIAQLMFSHIEGIQLYADDVFFLGDDWQGLYLKLEAFLEACKKHNCLVKPYSVKVGLEGKLEVLGFRLEDGVYLPGSKHVEKLKIARYPQSRAATVKLLAHISFFRCFSPLFAPRYRRIVDALDKQKKFRLTDEIKFEMASLVKVIADSPGLFTVDLQELSSGLVVCFVDSSEDTYSAVLVIVRNKELTPIQAVSRVHDKTDRNRHINHLELIGAYKSLAALRYFLDGISFLVLTDSGFVKAAMEKDPETLTKPARRLVLKIKENFCCDVRYIGTKTNLSDIFNRYVTANPLVVAKDKPETFFNSDGTIYMEKGLEICHFQKVKLAAKELEFLGAETAISKLVPMELRDEDTGVKFKVYMDVEARAENQDGEPKGEISVGEGMGLKAVGKETPLGEGRWKVNMIGEGQAAEDQVLYFRNTGQDLLKTREKGPSRLSAETQQKRKHQEIVSPGLAATTAWTVTPPVVTTGKGTVITNSIYCSSPVTGNLEAREGSKHPGSGKRSGSPRITQDHPGSGKDRQEKKEELAPGPETRMTEREQGSKRWRRPLVGCLKLVAQEAGRHQNAWVPIQQERMEEIYQGLREELGREQTRQQHKEIVIHNKNVRQSNLRFCSCNVEPETLGRLENMKEGHEREELEQEVWKQYKESRAERRRTGDGRQEVKENGPQNKNIWEKGTTGNQVEMRREEQTQQDKHEGMVTGKEREAKGEEKEVRHERQGEEERDVRNRIYVLEKMVRPGKLFSLQGQGEDQQEAREQECRWYPMDASQFTKAQVQIDETLKNIRTLSVSMSEIHKKSMKQDLVQMIIDLAGKTAQLRSLVDIGTLQETLDQERKESKDQKDSVKGKGGIEKIQENLGEGARVMEGSDDHQGEKGEKQGWNRWDEDDPFSEQVEAGGAIEMPPEPRRRGRPAKGTKSPKSITKPVSGKIWQAQKDKYGDKFKVNGRKQDLSRRGALTRECKKQYMEEDGRMEGNNDKHVGDLLRQPKSIKHMLNFMKEGIPSLRKEIRKSQMQDNDIKAISNLLEAETELLPHDLKAQSPEFLKLYGVRKGLTLEGGVLCHKSEGPQGPGTEARPVLPRKDRVSYIKNLHETMCHIGKEKLRILAEQKVFFPGMVPMIIQAVKTCAVCQKANDYRRKSKGSRGTILGGGAGQVYYADVAVLPKDEYGFRYLLVVVDAHANFIMAEPMRNLKAETASTALISILCRFGPCKQLYVDLGPEFWNRISQAMKETFGYEIAYVQPTQKNSNLAEGAIGLVTRFLRKACIARPHIGWSDLIPLVLYVNNTCPRALEGLVVSPLELFMVRYNKNPQVIGEEVKPRDIEAIFIEALEKREELDRLIHLARLKNRGYASKAATVSKWCPGDMVFFTQEFIRKSGKIRLTKDKLKARYAPGTIAKVHNQYVTVKDGKGVEHFRHTWEIKENHTPEGQKMDE
jgi:hypothetical protein